jgi:hypothetical protein
MEKADLRYSPPIFTDISFLFTSDILRGSHTVPPNIPYFRLLVHGVRIPRVQSFASPMTSALTPRPANGKEGYTTI